jgi:uncharacterized membrane protein YfcA
MPSEQPPAERREVNVRRAPKYVPFLILGALVGIAAAAVVAYAVPANPSFDAGAVFGFFMVLFAGRSIRRQQRAVVEAVPDSEPDTDLQP